MRLLVVEDNQKLAGLMAKRLVENLYSVDVVETVDDARAAVQLVDYDLILLDLSLPDGDGVEILRSLRRSGRTTRVFVSTARADVVQRIEMLDEGADDYLVKPFALDELLARIRALLRRSSEARHPVLEAGRLSLDVGSLTLRVGGQITSLPRRELGVLMALLLNQGRLVPRRKLEEAIYSFDADVTPNAIEAVVSRLRRRLEALDAGVAITAMRGLGYILAQSGTA
ncbi:two-component system, OmpR family, response regulator TctD [Enhydrobacter aerosaccus]|uniref:Two-component system, OmpR family, response regulator TctD n=1 Tax=Enhydrobacter aerosaccus TaxID=225324 RepID=A0A1T4SW10_9HYPH|nr:response regulator transcription factor [Enhydrobacter aerosaccus]SKA32455.1 two-component system, OmpR family, response regulator TctD [Enhydrobacter aerosaccus]